MHDKTRRSLFQASRYIKKGLKAVGLGPILPLREWHQRFKESIKTDHTFIDGFEMYLDKKDSLDLSVDDSYDEFDREILRQIVHPGDHVIDLGANIGFYTLTLARLVGPEGRVYAFEPSPENFALLSRNVQCNGFQAVTLVQKAVSNKNGKAQLFLCDTNAGDHRIFEAREDRQAVAIETVTLDDFFRDSSEDLHLIKMDIQGAEGMALEGMQGLLSRSRRLSIMMEFWPQGLVRCGADPGKVLDLLHSLGFQLKVLDHRRKSVEPIGKLNEFLNQPRFAEGKHSNLLCEKNG